MSWTTFTVDPFPDQALLQVRITQGHRLTGDILITVYFTSPFVTSEDQLASAADGAKFTKNLFI